LIASMVGLAMIATGVTLTIKARRNKKSIFQDILKLR
jgi:VIT1/CCC1 family predicted Fe2+/Mn2+ transporter